MCHNRLARRTVVLGAFFMLCTPASKTSAGESSSEVVRNAAVLDVPADAELLAAYQSDGPNQKVQNWGQYRGWVLTFYKGNLMSDGWTKFGQVTAGVVKSARARQAVITQINELGRIIGREWAKDSSVRKINTNDLKRWNDELATARQHDDGSGQQILAALGAVRRMAEGRHG